MPAAVEGHIPAWKRLGLKLKYAPEQTASVAPSNAAPSPAPAPQRKRKFGDEDNGINTDNADIESAKRSKKPKERAQIATNGNAASTSPALVPGSTPSKPQVHRKSVSFTPETKTEDGESSRDLYNSWLTSQKKSDPSFDPSLYGQDALRTVTPRSIAPSESSGETSIAASESADVKRPTKKKKKKKRNKSKSTTVTPTSSATPSSTTTSAVIPITHTVKDPSPNVHHPALTYLTQHHSSRTDWKFSKSRDSYIIRHIFSLAHIPASYDPALHDYLKRCESPAARKRIREQALEVNGEKDAWLDDSANFDGWKNLVIVVDEEEEVAQMDDPSKRHALFLRAVANHKILLRAKEDAREDREKEQIWREKVEKRRRAELVLCVLEEEARAKALRVGEKVEDEKEVGRGTMNGTKAIGRGAGGKPAEEPKAQPKGNRKRVLQRKRRRTGVPDDESSSSSSSSSESEDDLDGARDVKKVRLGPLASVDGPNAPEIISSDEDSSDDSDTSSSGSSEESESSSSGESG
ncbi:MAG: hypothetical protein Q9218_001313 [Villophora microphyllina]